MNRVVPSAIFREVMYVANNTAMEINEKDVKYLTKMVEGQ
jgi:hypothetical protein